MAGRRAPHPSQPTRTPPRAAAHLQTHPACTRRLTSTRSAPVRFGHSRVPVAARHTNTLGARCARVRRQAVARPRAPTAILGTQNGSDGRTVSFPQSNWIACVAHNSRRTESYSISCRCKSRDSVAMPTSRTPGSPEGPHTACCGTQQSEQGNACGAGNACARANKAALHVLNPSKPCPCHRRRASPTPAPAPAPAAAGDAAACRAAAAGEEAMAGLASPRPRGIPAPTLQTPVSNPCALAGWHAGHVGLPCHHRARRDVVHSAPP